MEKKYNVKGANCAVSAGCFGTVAVMCMSCQGSGTGSQVCYYCKRKGNDGKFKCNFCDGKGFSKCPGCNGTGQTR